MICKCGWTCCLLFPLRGGGGSRRAERSFLRGSLFTTLWWRGQFAEAGEHHLPGAARLSLGVLSARVRNGPEPINVPLKSLHPCIARRVSGKEVEEWKKWERKPSRHYNSMAFKRRRFHGEHFVLFCILRLNLCSLSYAYLPEWANMFIQSLLL